MQLEQLKKPLDIGYQKVSLILHNDEPVECSFCHALCEDNQLMTRVCAGGHDLGLFFCKSCMKKDQKNVTQGRRLAQAVIGSPDELINEWWSAALVLVDLKPKEVENDRVCI